MEQGTKNFHIILYTIIVLLIVSYGSFCKLTFAETNQLPVFDFNQIPEPVQSFINSAKQIESNITDKSSQVKFNSMDLKIVFGTADNWFYEITGVRLSDILRGIGNFFAWFFSALADLIRWAVAFL